MLGLSAAETPPANKLNPINIPRMFLLKVNIIALHIKNQKSEIRNQKSEIRKLLIFNLNFYKPALIASL
jgi:hypothetical protein